MINLLVLPFSIIGFLISYYIFYKKHRKREKMVCYIGTDCDRVIHSDYSKLLGIHLEVLGVLYYGAFSFLVLLPYLGVWMIAGFAIYDLIVVLSTVAFVFSFFLIYVQLFVIKEYCEYCLLSALMSTAIFIIETEPIWEKWVI